VRRQKSSTSRAQTHEIEPLAAVITSGTRTTQRRAAHAEYVTNVSTVKLIAEGFKPKFLCKTRLQIRRKMA
jgi:hypothetical protein